jgi:hypothetical protein
MELLDANTTRGIQRQTVDEKGQFSQALKFSRRANSFGCIARRGEKYRKLLAPQAEPDPSWR